ncbi:hypothetical protein PDE_01626 [Penicillium oxalicum 114-2]|uniref:Carbonic anhydrase n=1 Tax=Penicillium oxalicum (strain 114-2 / CGMCC 5302) TaxID=933388 RepID=S8ALE9_PENO1|nr:hypothetical protein PDE_01626 [Penicillium oxalicum 114-2]
MPIRMYTESPTPPSPSPSQSPSHSEPPPIQFFSYETRAIGTNFLSRPRSPLDKQILWIGCSDSDCKETTILDFLPDEMLELRNLGNMIIPDDLSCETLVRHAVVELKVKHIVVCGHYGCGIVRASSRNGVPGPWLRKLDSLHAKHRHLIDHVSASDRDAAFVELNILDQLRSLRGMSEVAEASRRGHLSVHGIVYDPRNGQALSINESGEEES